MSGLEVTGVVLGAIPLVISALEHYSIGVCLTQVFHTALLTKQIQLIKNIRNYAIVFEEYSTQVCIKQYR